MSRIDEALRRASDRPESTVAPALEREGDGASLESYPVEREAAPARAFQEFTRAGTIIAPRVGHARLAPAGPAADGKIVGSGHMSAVSLEQYRRLATALVEAQAQRGIKSVLVSSALPKEGKTLTSSNLALTLSESYARRVLLIDADLRRPSVHTLFRLPNTGGLSEGLRAEGTQLPLVEVSPTLAVLPGGSADSDPMAGLASDRMEALMKEATARFDWIVVDSPPLGVLSDAQLLARLVDGVLLVIGAGLTPYTLVQRAIAELGPDRVLGVVLNQADERLIPSAYHYYEHYASVAARR